MKNLKAQVLEASLSDPNDAFETTMVGTFSAPGITDELFGSGKRVKWTEEDLIKFAPTLKDMPVTLEIDPEDETGQTLVKHSKTIIGRIKDAYYDANQKKAVYIAALHKHLFPKTIAQLAELKAADKAEVSWEFVPTELEPVPDEGDNVVRPLGGRYGALAIINKGADLGNSIALLASAVEEEAQKIEDENKANPRAGSFEWIGNMIVQKLTAGATPDSPRPFEVIETYPDNSIYVENGRYFKLPYTIDGNNIKFSDTIEVEPTYQPLGASAVGSSEVEPEVTPTPHVEETTVTDIDEKELAALRASAAEAEKLPDLETENSTLKAENEALKAANAEAEAFKAKVEAEKEEARLNTLAASRIEEVEKIVPYKDEKQKAEDTEAFKTMDEKAFDIVKRTLVAAAEVRGGISAEDPINPPESREDADGAARDILESDEYKALKASLASKEGK